MHASMGPRFINRGEKRDMATYYQREAASMGPRFINRGEFVGVTATEDDDGLQWGRGL